MSIVAAPDPIYVTAPVPAPIRLQLGSGEPRHRLLDGGWWPQSTDPVAELPGLVLAIDAVHGPIDRLVLSADGWADHPRRLAVGDRVIRLGFFASQPVTLLTAMTRNGQRVDLLVVAPGTDAGVAAAAIGLATTEANRVPAPQLMLSAAARLPGRPETLSEQVWDNDGGRPPAVVLPTFGRARPTTVISGPPV